MSTSTVFLPSRDLRDLRTLDLASAECLQDIRTNLDSLGLALGASGGRIVHAPPRPIQNYNGPDDEEPLPTFEEPPKEVDSFEKGYVTRWLTRLVSEFTMICTDDVVVAAQANHLSERCAELLALSAGRMAAGASVQDHVFQLQDSQLIVKLRDGALVHDSLGTHTWGAAPILSQLLLPLQYSTGTDISILELGAGTGLVGLSIALWSRQGRTTCKTQLVCTDYHPIVLENLAHNIALNGFDKSLESASAEVKTSVRARALDWQSVHRAGQAKQASQTEQQLTSQTLPSHLLASEDADWAQALDVEACSGTFDVIVAADCVYDPVHPLWIRSVAEKLLQSQTDPLRHPKPLLHLMVPLRPTHQQEMRAVYDAFAARKDCSHPQLVILAEQDYKGYENFGAANSVVRSDSSDQSQPEGGLSRTYRWFQIGWKE